ncbi:universal stress protein [Frigoribacterium sp. 2-23]|uniref:universal stress protein n=1 Tax=Frigoribacterium sp. 2-23 TaxID=3415006 RepID=UPI003C6F3193
MTDRLEGMNGYVVVGVVRRTAPVVLREAAIVARRFGTGLAVVSVDPDRLAFAEGIDGSVVSYPVDLPGDDEEPEFDDELATLSRTTLDRHGVPYRLIAVIGDAAQSLARIASSVDAPMIVVGSREAGLRGSVREFFAGSVAVHLTHRQSRPVLVVPLEPVGRGDALPWDDEL